MPRKRVLTNEQVWVIRQSVGDKTVAAYAKEFGVSYATAYNAKKGLANYKDFNFTNEFEFQMVEKYFPEEVRT